MHVVCSTFAEGVHIGCSKLHFQSGRAAGQVVLAARAAAGLNRGGIRRTAFSLGDLHALEVAGPPSPPETPRTVHRCSALVAARGLWRCTDT